MDNYEGLVRIHACRRCAALGFDDALIFDKVDECWKGLMCSRVEEGNNIRDLPHLERKEYSRFYRIPVLV